MMRFDAIDPRPAAGGRSGDERIGAWGKEKNGGALGGLAPQRQEVEGLVRWLYGWGSGRGGKQRL